MWQVTTAKTHFSELLNRAETEGPQRLQRRGKTFVLLTEEALDGLRGKPRMSLGEFLLNAPKVHGLVIPRDRSLPRLVDLGPDDG